MVFCRFFSGSNKLLYVLLKGVLGYFQTLPLLQWFLYPPHPHPHRCCGCERTNERIATAFPLIVISLSGGELSHDEAHTEQFSSPPIQTAAVFAEAEQLNGGKTREERTDRQKKLPDSDLTLTITASSAECQWKVFWPFLYVWTLLLLLI